MAVNLMMSLLNRNVQPLFSYVKNTLDFLQIVDGLNIPTEAYLVTIDVECLYNSIPYLRVQVIKSFLDQMNDSHLE